MTFCEGELLPISALQHLAFCERQWALIHLEQVWGENRFTAEGRNLMVEKYARMQGLIPCRDDSAAIDRIVEMEGGWQDELSHRYPQLFAAQSMQAFELYLRSELETYSDRTLELYLRDICESADEKRNLAEERYTVLAKCWATIPSQPWFGEECPVADAQHWGAGSVQCP